MTTSSTNAPSTPRATIFLLLAYLLHLLEEWFGGFLAWVPTTLGYDISPQRFILINATALMVFVISTFLALSPSPHGLVQRLTGSIIGPKRGAAYPGYLGLW